MRILVTGGLGFIGSHLVEKLVEQEHQVSIIDNLSSGKTSNLASKEGVANPTIYLTKLAELRLVSILKMETPEAIFHLAARKQSGEQCELDLPIAEFLVRHAVSQGVKKFIFTSSDTVYGVPERLPVDEKHRLAPRSQYAETKVSIEKEVRFARRKAALYARLFSPIVHIILRIGNVYGPRQSKADGANAIAIIGEQIKKAERPVIFGDGTRTRDYVFVNDVIRALLDALSSKSSGCYNIGSGVETSDRQIFDSVAAALNYHQEPLYSEAKRGEPAHIRLDIEKARKALGWEPIVSLDNGIALTFP